MGSALIIGGVNITALSVAHLAAPAWSVCPYRFFHIPVVSRRITTSKDNKQGIKNLPSITSIMTDAKFKEYLISQFDTDGDGRLSEAEVLAVDEMFFQSLGYTIIASLEGIQYFTNLTTIYVWEGFTEPEKDFMKPAGVQYMVKKTD